MHRLPHIAARTVAGSSTEVDANTLLAAALYLLGEYVRAPGAHAGAALAEHLEAWAARDGAGSIEARRAAARAAALLRPEAAPAAYPH